MGKMDINPSPQAQQQNAPLSKTFTSPHFEDWIPLLSKKDKAEFLFKNLSLNPSLSYTLSHFVTKVRIEESHKDTWSPFKNNPFKEKPLYQSNNDCVVENLMPLAAQKRFLDFFKFLKRCFKIPGYYQVFSQNNFPSSIGAASSASSFAALSMAVYKLAMDRSTIKNKLKKMQPQDLAFLSRMGSGSSCRCFFSPWCIWQNQTVIPFNAPWNTLDHQLVIVDSQPKKISSQQAHQFIKTSPHFKSRPKRATKRLKLLCQAFHSKNWEQCFKICYEEFIDMHALFETSSPPFQYKTKQSQNILDHIQRFWKDKGDGPVVTMDAGANIHLLYRPDQKKQKEEIHNLLSDYIVLSSL